MKKSLCILALVWCALTLMFAPSCNDMPSYEDLKKKEMKTVQRLLNDHNITVLNEYPKDGVFGENEFVLLSNGIYLNVVDSGTGNRAESGITDVLMRVSGEYYYGDSLYKFNTFANTSQPFDFRYGNAYNVMQANSNSYLYYSYFGVGFETVLSYVGDSAIVKMLVPGHAEAYDGIPAGSVMQSGDGYSFLPILFNRVRYIFN